MPKISVSLPEDILQFIDGRGTHARLGIRGTAIPSQIFRSQRVCCLAANI